MGDYPDPKQWPFAEHEREAGRQAGRQEILAKVRALPTPFQQVEEWQHLKNDNTWVLRRLFVCEWCQADDTVESALGGVAVPLHPANDCLWALAHAASPPERE